MNSIAFCVIASNSFFTLGIRFLSKFNYFYRGKSKVKFHFFSNVNPKPYIPDGMGVIYKPVNHQNWLEGANSKSDEMLSLLEKNDSTKDFNYLYYVDADTDITKYFNEDWFLGNMVGFEHFMNDSFIKQGDYPFDRNPKSSCYIPLDSKNLNLYYHACFYGGHVDKMKPLCELMVSQQMRNKKINHEPPVNDESHLNCCFHKLPPIKIIETINFEFVFSDKGGIEDIRNPDLDLEDQKTLIRENRNKLFEIVNGKVCISAE